MGFEGQGRCVVWGYIDYFYSRGMEFEKLASWGSCVNTMARPIGIRRLIRTNFVSWCLCLEHVYLWWEAYCHSQPREDRPVMKSCAMVTVQASDWGMIGC